MISKHRYIQLNILEYIPNDIYNLKYTTQRWKLRAELALGGRRYEEPLTDNWRSFVGG